MDKSHGNSLWNNFAQHLRFRSDRMIDFAKRALEAIRRFLATDSEPHQPIVQECDFASPTLETLVQGDLQTRRGSFYGNKSDSDMSLWPLRLAFMIAPPSIR